MLYWFYESSSHELTQLRKQISSSPSLQPLDGRTTETADISQKAAEVSQ